MKDQLITALGAIVACAILYALLFSSPPERTVTRPISEEPGRNGYLALRDWLSGQEVPVVSWRESFGALADDEQLSPTGNVMLTTLPHRLRLRLTELPSLREWISQGNTLLLTAALNDTPDWTGLTDSQTLFDGLTRITGLEFEVATTLDDDRQPVPLGSAIEPDSAIDIEPLPHPLMDGVTRLQSWSDGPSSLWHSATRYVPGPPLLQLAVVAGYDTPAIYELPQDRGRIIILLSTSLLSNHQIAEADAARFVANIIGHHVSGDGAFVFDDMHQGLSSLYDPAAFIADKRLHRTIIFLMAAWFLYLIGASNRVAPIKPDRAGPSQATLLAGIGGFLARRLGRVETGRLLFEDWFGEIRRHRGVSAAGGPPWPTLAATPTLNKALLTRLQDAYARLEQGDAVDLVELNNLILNARKAIG
jgi:hypothetical protein